MDPIVVGLIFVVAVNIFIFPIAYKLQTDKLTDIIYALSFSVLVVYGFVMGDGMTSVVKIMVSGLILLWAIRLGAFLLYRVNSMGKDDRFDEIRTSPIRFLRWFFLQGVSSWIIMLPALYILLTHSGAIADLPNTLMIEWAGLIIALLGLSVEAIADKQKADFKSIEGNSKKLYTDGLYGVIRYPNYLGEIAFWVGIFIVAIPVLSGFRWLAVISPITIVVLLVFVSGIPIIEKSRRKKFGQDDAYKAYVKNTAKLIPGVY